MGRRASELFFRCDFCGGVVSYGMTIKPQKVYLETTVFNYFFDSDRLAHPATIKLFEEIKAGKYIAYTSAYVVEEIEKSNDPKKSKMLELLGKYEIEVLQSSVLAEQLCEEYMKGGAIPTGSRYDGLHIAVATLNEMDYIVSLNFKHINRVRTKIMTEAINKVNGYNKEIAICAPMEIVGVSDNE